MENREQQILSEIKVMMESIRTQLELLDAKMVELQQCVDPEDFDNDPIELDIDVPVTFEEDAVTEVVMDDLPEPEVEEVESESVEAVTDEDIPEPAGEAESVEDPEEDDDDIPGVFDQPVPLYQAAQSSPVVKPSVAEVMAENHPWRTDMPGTPVKDVRSAISLNDRIIFINYLFDEDPMAFQNAINQINAMTSLDQVVAYVKAERPEWDLNSELVYRFMMAVRRRVK